MRLVVRGGNAYRGSLYLFAVTQSLHLVAVTTFVGAILIGDLRMLGWGPIRQSRPSIARDMKGRRTAVYALKRKLMAACLGIAIREVAA